MKQSRRAADTFQSQLQQKLNSITNTKSHKKIKIKHPLEQANYYKYELDQYSQISPNTEANDNHDNRLSQISEQPNPNINSQQKLKLSVNVEEIKKKSGRKQNVIDLDEVPRPVKKGAVDLVQNKQLRSFLQTNFGQKCENLDLSYFLAKCLAEFSHQPSLPEEQIKIIFLELQQDITTTDPNIISLNALELAIKKNYGSFELYIGSKIIGAEQQLMSRKLKQKQKQLEKMSSQNQKQKDNKQKQLSQTERILIQREKEVSKKQKSLLNKQKQFMERIKNHKKMLQQRAQKLTEEHVSKLEQVCEKIEKKVNTYERTMKYRVQTMNHKINQIHHLRQFKEGEIRSSIVKEVEEKYDKAYGNKMRKHENQHKEMVEKCELLRKQCKQLEDENNKFASIVSKLEAKVMRQDAKIKELIEELGTKKSEIKQLQFLCTEKHKQNEKLIKKLLTYRQQQQDGNEKSQKQLKMKVSSSNKSLSSKKKINKGDTVDLESAPQGQLKQVIEVYEATLHAIKNDRNSELSQQIVGKSLLLIVRIIGNEHLSCQFLLDLTFDNVLRKSCEQFAKNDVRSRKQSKSVMKSSRLTEIEPVVSQQIQKYLKSTKKHKKQYRHQFVWKLWCIMYILCSNQNNNKNYLTFIYNQSQNSVIFNQMQTNLTNNQYNFIYALIIKYVNDIQQESQDLELNTLTLLTDLVLDFKLVGQPKFDKFWKFVGQQVIRCFLLLVKGTIHDNKYFHEFYDAIEKISIMVQRLVVAHELPLPNESSTIFSALMKKCRGSLLERNLNSILETLGCENILGEVEEE